MFNDVESLKEHLCDIGCEDAIVFDPDFAEAAIGVSDNDTVVYDYDKMVECLVKEGMDEESAMEYIDFNAIRSLPYMGPNAPIVLRRFEE